MSTFEAAGPPGQAWKVGTLAKAAGLTVRALHYDDQIGLLMPSQRTPAGHRLYDPAADRGPFTCTRPRSRWAC
jgi:hypothetical protein